MLPRQNLEAIGAVGANLRQFSKSRIQKHTIVGNTKFYYRAKYQLKRLKIKKLQFQTKIVETLRPNAVFSLLMHPLSLSNLFVAVHSPNLVHQH